MRGVANAASGGPAGSNRRQPTRSARSSTTRPSNYYARPIGYQNSTNVLTDDVAALVSPPGFFPAITHFTDGLSALPKEVMRHFTLIKETEGKAYLPGQAISEILDTISKLPEPPSEPQKQHPQPFLGFSLNNSANGSVAGSVVDGSVPGTQHTLPEMQDRPQIPNEHLEARRACFSNLRDNVKAMLSVLDEKNMVLTSANDTLSRQLARLDGTLPHVETEISEEARLGSNTHWALPHMRELRKVNGPAATDRSRRDVQAANSLAAAAAAIHEGDIAATRSEARREAVQAKRRHNLDSDFDDRPPTKRAPGAKSRKNQEVVGAADGKGTAGSQPQKRRRVEKIGASAMERSASGAANGRQGSATHRERETGAEAPPRKKNKPLPAAAIAKKRHAPSSPSIASSPTRGTFATTTHKEPPSIGAPRSGGNSRGRQNSAQSTKLTGVDAARRPASATSSLGHANGANIDTPELKGFATALAKTGADPRSAARAANTSTGGEISIEEEGVQGALVIDGSEASGNLKREETEPMNGMGLPGSTYNARGDNSRVQSGSRTSKPGTPVEGGGAKEPAAGTGMARSRSTRGHNGNNAARGGAATISPATRPADESTAPRRTHKKSVKAYAESTRSSTSPPLAESVSAGASHARKGSGVASRNEYTLAEEDEEEATLMQGEDGYASSDEPRYCICNGHSYGNMIGCDNKDCPREWFHLACVGMTKLPGPRAKWYCEECKENMRSREQLRRR